MKGEKLTVENLCAGELKTQVANALHRMAENIEKYGSSAEHGFTVSVSASENLEFHFWEMDCKTSVNCKTSEKQIGSKAPVKIEKSVMYDGNTQSKLEFK